MDTHITREHKRVIGSYVINLKDLGIRNVKDMVFLHGYYEPTVLILYEPTAIWTG
jgi:cleavage and polyadenylation specificity factor subunit 1